MTETSPTGSMTHWRDEHPASWPESQLMGQCRITFSRASGPGGQNRNKVETSVQIEYLPNKIMASASERRTQIENRKIALQRLRCKLAIEIRPTALGEDSITSLVANGPSMIWRLYCRDGRIDIAETNTDWPTVLAELIGTLAQREWDMSRAAAILTTSSSQLTKLLKKYPPAFSLLNQERAARGLRPLD